MLCADTRVDAVRIADTPPCRPLCVTPQIPGTRHGRKHSQHGLKWSFRYQMRPYPEETALIGEVVAKYRILEEIGRGSTGVVYKAQDTFLGRLAALKLIAEEFRSEERR